MRFACSCSSGEVIMMTTRRSSGRSTCNPNRPFCSRLKAHAGSARIANLVWYSAYARSELVTTVNPAVVGTYVDRLRRTQDHLKAQAVDLLLVGPSSDLFYLTGFEAHESERMNLLLVPQQGEPKMVMPELE